jgi:hypothetical protein
MGITIAFRGRLADLERLEDFEDRLLDLALDIGGEARIWRSHADTEPRRIVRGIVLEVAPGLESLSLLVSPEGWLIGLTDIEDAECGRLGQRPWVFIKTQFGPLEAHVVVVELLDALRREFIPDLEVRDEGGYWETRDAAELTRRHDFLKRSLELMADGLSRFGLSPEAAEDPQLLRRHIERLAARVHRILHRPPEHAPVSFADDEPGVEPTPAETEAAWDELYKHNRRQQERLQRALEERLSQGEEVDSAFDNALRDIGLEPPEASDADSGEPRDDEPPACPAANDTIFEDEERHPLMQAAFDLQHALHKLGQKLDTDIEPTWPTLCQGAGDVFGGLAQALAEHGDDDELDSLSYGLRLTQFKRAARGAAFARGALLALRGKLGHADHSDLEERLRRLERDIFRQMHELRAQAGDDDN